MKFESEERLCSKVEKDSIFCEYNAHLGGAGHDA